jgi:hypothetical protein
MFSWGRKGGHVSEADLSAFADGALTPRLRTAVEAHVGDCAECAGVIAELRSTRTLVAQLPRPQTQRSFTLPASYAAVRPVRPSPARHIFTFAPAMAMTVLVLLLAADLLPGSSSSSSSSGSASVAGSVTDATSGLTTKSNTGPPPSPTFNTQLAPAEVPPVPRPASAGGAVPPTPATSGSRDVPNLGQQAPKAPPETPAPAILSAPRTGPGQTPPVAGQPGTREGFAPATPVVPRDDALKSTGGPAEDEGISTLRWFEILAALALMVSGAAFVWDRRRRT